MAYRLPIFRQRVPMNMFDHVTLWVSVYLHIQIMYLPSLQAVLFLKLLYLPSHILLGRGRGRPGNKARCLPFSSTSVPNSQQFLSFCQLQFAEHILSIMLLWEHNCEHNRHIWRELLNRIMPGKMSITACGHHEDTVSYVKTSQPTHDHQA